MGIMKKLGNAAGNRVARLSSLTSEQIEIIQEEREAYLTEIPNPNDSTAKTITDRMLAATSVEVFHAFLPQLKSLYLPIESEEEYGEAFHNEYNIRFINITKWVSDKKENSIEKLINVYAVLSNECCNIALIFNRTKSNTQVYLAVVNTENAVNNVNANIYKNRLVEAIRGNFPGAEWSDDGCGIPPCFQNDKVYSVATATNIPTEKSEKFVSQTIEKLLDGVIPDSKKKEYTIVLLATPILDIEARKLRLGEFYSGMAPYASWQTDYHFNDTKSIGSGAVVGVNVGASAGVQNGVSNTISENSSFTNQSSDTSSDSFSDSSSESSSEGLATNESVTNTNGSSDSVEAGIHISYSQVLPSAGVGNVGTSVNYNHSWNRSTAETAGKTVSNNWTKGVSNTVSKSISKSLGKAVTKGSAKVAGISKAANLGGNFGANFARSSSVTATVGVNEGIIQTFTNYNIKHALELLEMQMKRMEQSSALGMWDFAAYILSEDANVANNVAHTYLALTAGEDSNMSKSAVNLWKGNVEKDRESARVICNYLRSLRHPLFGLNPNVLDVASEFYVYPSLVTATTNLSGKELAYSLNFPQHSISGLPILECAEFGRNVINYNISDAEDKHISLGSIFHMNRKEKNKVVLSCNSLASHTFITGSTGSGKSNTVYQLISKAVKENIKFLIIEPAKGEYKNVFGLMEDVHVYGTNPSITSLLKLNPFSFDKNIHVFEHIDRLVEIFNVCWPMYAAMPAVLKKAIVQSYEDCGWDMISSNNPYGDYYPSFKDVSRNIYQILDSSEYDAENKSAYKGALLTRLESLTTGINGLLFSEDEISSEILFDENCILDLSRVGSQETKSLIMGIIILKLQEYRMSTSYANNVNTKHITILEEAHNILKNVPSNSSSEGANLVGKSVEMISNAIAEMRAYGEGFIIVDQAPGLLDKSVIRNTNTKIIMRLPDYSDRELVGRAANLNDDQILELAKLPKGVAAVYQNEWVQPVLCKVDEYKYDKERNYQTCSSIAVNSTDIDISDKLYIAEILCLGMPLSEELILHDLKEKLDLSRLSSYEKVTIIKMAMSSSRNPRITKIAPFINALLPTVTDAVRRSYNDSNDACDWTLAAESNLNSIINIPIEEQLRKDIVQCAITQYLWNEIHNEEALQEWSRKGGF